MQNIIPLPDKTGLKLTVALYYTPSGKSIQAEGIVPDFEILWEAPKEKDFTDSFNWDSIRVLDRAVLEGDLAGAKAGDHFQFLRQGYFCVDNKDSKPGHLVFNRSVSLKDSFKK